MGSILNIFKLRVELLFIYFYHYATGEQSGVRNPVEARDFLLSETYGLALESTQPPIKWLRGSLLRTKRPGREVHHSSPSSAKLKNEWRHTPSQRLRWSRGSVLAFGTQVRGFKSDRSRWIFRGEKILSTPSFWGEVMPSVPCCRFTACKSSLNVTWKSGICRQNSSAISHPSSSSFHY